MQLSIRNSRVICVAISLLMLIVVSGCGMSDEKKQVQERNIRFSPDILSRLDLTEKWFIKSLGGGSATVLNIEKSGNNLFVFSSNCVLYCIDMVTGQVKWGNQLPRRYGNQAYLSFYKDRILIGVSNSIYEFVMNSGVETNHWEVSVSPTTSVARNDGMLFFGATDSRFYSLKLPLLTEVWKSLHSGQPKGKVWLETSMNGDEEVGNVYYSCDNGTMYAAKSNKRDLVWSLTTTGEIPGSVFDGGQCFVPSTDTALYCVDSVDGRVFWKYLTGGKLLELPSVTSKRVYQAVRNKSLVCLERFPEGKKPGAGMQRLEPSVVWELPGGTNFLCEMGDRVFVTNEAGQMVVMNNRTGKQEYSVYLNGADVFFGNTQDEMLILADKTGNIMVLQAAQ